MKITGSIVKIFAALLLTQFSAAANESAPDLSTNPFDRPGWMDEKRIQPASSTAPRTNEQIILRATLVAGNDSLAAVGEKILAIGQEIYGYKLLSVSNGSAIFSDGANKLHVKIAGDQKEQDNETD